MFTIYKGLNSNKILKKENIGLFWFINWLLYKTLMIINIQADMLNELVR